MRLTSGLLAATTTPVGAVVANADNEKARSLDGIVAWLAKFHDGYPVVGVLVLLMGIDVASGICAAFVAKNVSSTTCGTGMIRKVLMLLLVGACAVIEPYSGDLPLSKLAAMAFCVVEFMSIIENAQRAGVPIPPVITDALKIMNREEKSGPAVAPSVNVGRAARVDVYQDSAIPHTVNGEDLPRKPPKSEPPSGSPVKIGT